VKASPKQKVELKEEQKKETMMPKPSPQHRKISPR
jgi:hypothetical protein